MQDDSEPGGALSLGGSQLEQALGALPPDEKYNAVLLSLFSSGATPTSAASALELVDEMTAKRLQLSSAALKGLLDLTVNDGTPEEILSSLLAAKKNGACRSYASPQLRLPNRPSASARAALPPTPTDGRSSEVTAAAAFSFAVGVVLLAEIADLLDFLLPVDISAPPPTFVLIALAAGWAFDRYARSGEIFGLIGRGLTRLFQRDLQRECAVESASFLLGYLLGLPCCPFAPTVFKPLDMLSKSAGAMAADVGVPARLADRVLIWLLAPAAVETMVYRCVVARRKHTCTQRNQSHILSLALCARSEMLQSEPSLGTSFLEAARRREASLGVDVQDGGWSLEEDEERVRWAYSEARKLLQRYSGVREALQERMSAGVSAGECVVLIEERLKNLWSVV